MTGKKHIGGLTVNPETTIQNEMEAWEMRARGMTQTEIAKKLSVTQSTISKMLAKARKTYHKHYIKRIEQVQTENIALYNRIVSEAMHAWFNSLEFVDHERSPHGNAEFLHIAIKANERLAKALGTDAPARTENKNDNKNENTIKEFTLKIPNANQLEHIEDELPPE